MRVDSEEGKINEAVYYGLRKVTADGNDVLHC